MKHLTKNIFLDTNIYEENNFLHGTKIHNLFYYSRIGLIRLYMTTISYWELIDRMKKGLETVKIEHNKYVNSLNKTRILRNLNAYQNVEKLRFNVQDTLNELKNKLDVNIRASNIQIIKANNVNIEEIFDLYYNELPPFSNKAEKKHEFPDAFIIKTIERWCEENKTKMIFLTHDNDYNNIKCKRLIFKDNVSDLLEDISKYYDSMQSTHLIPEIERRLQVFKEDILALIDDEFENRVIFDIDYERISEIKRTSVKLINYKITSISPEQADIEYFVEVKFSFWVFPSKLDIERTVFSDNLKPKIYSEKIIVPCDLVIRFNIQNDIRLKWINSNVKIKLKLE